MPVLAIWNAHCNMRVVLCNQNKSDISEKKIVKAKRYRNTYIHTKFQLISTSVNPVVKTCETDSFFLWDKNGSSVSSLNSILNKKDDSLTF